MADMSFLPEDYIEKRAQRRTNFICVTLFIIVMSAVVAAYFVSDEQRREVRDQWTDVNRRVAEAGRLLEQLDELQKRKDQMVRKAKITGTLVERVPRTLILSQVINNMPATLSLFEFELETTVVQAPTQAKTKLQKAKAKAKAKSKDDDETLPEPDKTRVVISIEGVARTDVEVAQFMTDLKNLPLFSSVNLGFSEEIKIQDEPMRKFKIQAVVNQDLDLENFEPLMVKRELKQNPMGNTIEIDGDGAIVSPADSPLIKNASDKRRTNLRD